MPRMASRFGPTAGSPCSRTPKADCFEAPVSLTYSHAGHPLVSTL